MMPPEQEIPLFPLHTVLFPGGPLPLRIFETRYLDMVRCCLRTQSTFGVILIHSGTETGPVHSTASVGTSARVVDFQQLPDGLLGILCVGERKFRLSSRSRQDDGLHVGSIEWLPPEREVTLPVRFGHFADLLRRVLPELGGLHAPAAARFDDASWVSYRLTEILPLSLADKQYYLELEDPLERLERLEPLVKFQA